MGTRQRSIRTDPCRGLGNLQIGSSLNDGSFPKAKYNELMATDPELKSWLQGLAKLRTVESDSIHQELRP